MPQQPATSTVASPPIAAPPTPTLTVPALAGTTPPTALQPTPVVAQPQLAGEASDGESGDGPAVSDITLANGGVLPLQSAVTVPLQGRAIKFEGRWFHIGPVGVGGVDILS